MLFFLLIHEPRQIFNLRQIFFYVYSCVTNPRAVMLLAGRRAYHQLTRPKVLIVVAAVSTMLFTFWRCSNIFKTQSETREIDVNTDYNEQKCIKVRNDDVENPWYKNDYELSTFRCFETNSLI